MSRSTFGESKRSWKPLGAEHQPGISYNREAAIKEHAERTGHEIHPDYVELLERCEMNRRKRLSLEAWHADKNTITEHIELPRVHVF